MIKPICTALVSLLAVLPLTAFALSLPKETATSNFIEVLGVGDSVRFNTTIVCKSPEPLKEAAAMLKEGIPPVFIAKHMAKNYGNSEECINARGVVEIEEIVDRDRLMGYDSILVRYTHAGEETWYVWVEDQPSPNERPEKSA